MSRSVQWPPIQGRGYSVRELMSVGAGITPPNRPPRPESAEGPPSPPARPEPVEGPPPPPSPPARPEPAEGPPAEPGTWPEPVEGRPVTLRAWSIGAATRALATSVSRPIWLCHHPLHAIAPSQKFV